MAQQIINNALQEWSAEIAKAKSDLRPSEDGAYYIMSLTRRKQGIVGGMVTKVSADVAALMIAGETHREATVEESEAWEAEQSRKRTHQLAEAAKRESKVNLDLGPLAEVLLKMGMNMGSPQAAPALVPAPAQAAPAAAAPVSAPEPAPAAPVVPPVAQSSRPSHRNQPAKPETAVDDASRF